MKKANIAVLSAVLCIAVVLSCSTSTEPEKTVSGISGAVKIASAGTEVFVHPAYIFLQDSLFATTDGNGRYSISALDKGSYLLTCSAVGFRDTTALLSVKEGINAVQDFLIAPDSTVGKIAGEFQDITLYSESLKTKPEMADWNPKQTHDGVTGATLQELAFDYELPERKIFLGDSLLAVTDGFGQYWFELQIGTYMIRGSCAGYEDAEQVIRVLPDVKTYYNFFLPRQDGY